MKKGLLIFGFIVRCLLIQANPEYKIEQNIVEADENSFILKILADASELAPIDPDSAIINFDFAVSAAEKSQNRTLQLQVYLISAEACNTMSRFTQTYKYAKKAEKVAEELNDIDGIVRSEVIISSILNTQGKFKQSNEILIKAIEKAGKSGNALLISKVLNELSVNYALMENYAKALEYEYKAINLKEKLKDTASVIQYLNNISEIYQKANDLGNTEKTILRIIELYKKTRQKEFIPENYLLPDLM